MNAFGNSFHNYLAGGLSLVPCGRDKRPTVKWKEFQQRRPSAQELDHWLAEGIQSFAAICGEVSGELEIIDFDDNPDAQPLAYSAVDLFEAWQAEVGHLAKQYGVVIQRTGGGGFQVAYRCPQPDSNQKLAWIPDEPQEHGRSVSIETRGEGGYAIVAPSLHPSGNRYRMVAGDFAAIPVVPQDVRDAFIEAARRLDLMPYTSQELHTAKEEKRQSQTNHRRDGVSVIDTFNDGRRISEVLAAQGYTRGQNGRYSRPGKTESLGVVVLERDNVSFHWSSNDPLHKVNAGGKPLPIDPFDVYCLFEHKGDMRGAVKSAAYELGIAKTPHVYTNGHHKNGASVASVGDPVEPPPDFDEQGQDGQGGAEPTLDVLKYRAEDGGVLDAWRDLYGDKWIFSVGHDRWYYWNKTHWAVDDSLKLQESILDLMDRMNRECSRILRESPEEIKSIVDKFSGAGVDVPPKAIEEIERLKIGMEVSKALHKATKRSNHRVSSVDGIARDKRKSPTARFNAMESLNLANGTLSLLSLELLPHNPDDLCTYCLNYEYNPAADCPRFIRFLQEVLVKEDTFEPDQELISLFQELVGYSLTTQTKYQVMAWMSGEGGNGKSVAIAILKALLGAMAVSVDFQTLGTPGNYDMADIPGARVLFSLESEKGVGVSEKHIKSIVTGDPMKTRPIYGTTIDFVSTAKIWWAMNDKPVIRDTTNAIWRRLKLIPFNRSFEEGKNADTELVNTLLGELSGILNWAIEGLVRLTNSKKFTVSEVAGVAKEQYREQSNPVAQWLKTMAVKTEYPATLLAALYLSFRGWCIDNGERMVTSTQFALDLKRLKVDSKRKNVGVMYCLAIVSGQKV